MTKVSLQKLLQKLTTGVGATELPKTVRQITLTLQKHSSSYSARYFIRQNLPRLQYQNPEVTFVINRPAEYQSPKMEVLLADGTTKELKITQPSSDAVCKDLLRLVGAEKQAV
ncbi:hypothetical protein THASP1DRAFT_33457 [Thamnocephalis sphaerospora]|uniref:Ribosomal protein/NADH dehydrogenase domain-containing protein n=1 Tax=Thamnocephalis sphaerospora TaxID=78915 RepID=A0A4P9XHI6_9FUNG|nr:hypothetical protein THASP1DRAFT_33457 [Thamnocephalis sphaerospora]|eukprot:RKP04741.1 hypothetical protein THASP1DRAFT_33457 [Thamnocephalis sphaerospora]